MIPLTLSNPIWTSLGLSIICGLTVSTIFTLVVLPSLYFVVFGKGDRSLKLKVES
jgi:multidrug efflux pump subunit AcrB